MPPTTTTTAPRSAAATPAHSTAPPRLPQGLNGSGKSNILDAICFVLGISNLSQVRASNLQELVYKQGQAGVTKATVSVVFNNSDVKASPVGYEACETITVTRQVRAQSRGGGGRLVAVWRRRRSAPHPASRRAASRE